MNTFTLSEALEEQLCVKLICNGILIPYNELNERIGKLIEFALDLEKAKTLSGYRFSVTKTGTVKENVSLLADGHLVLYLCENWDGDSQWNILYIDFMLLHPSIYRALINDKWHGWNESD